MITAVRVPQRFRPGLGHVTVSLKQSRLECWLIAEETVINR